MLVSDLLYSVNVIDLYQHAAILNIVKTYMRRCPDYREVFLYTICHAFSHVFILWRGKLNYTSYQEIGFDFVYIF